MAKNCVVKGTLSSFQILFFKIKKATINVLSQVKYLFSMTLMLAEILIWLKLLMSAWESDARCEESLTKLLTLRMTVVS